MQHLIGHVPVKRRSRFRETAVTLWCNDGHFPVNSASMITSLPWPLILRIVEVFFALLRH